MVTLPLNRLRKDNCSLFVPLVKRASLSPLTQVPVEPQNTALLASPLRALRRASRTVLSREARAAAAHDFEVCCVPRRQRARCISSSRYLLLCSIHRLSVAL